MPRGDRYLRLRLEPPVTPQRLSVMADPGYPRARRAPVQEGTAFGAVEDRDHLVELCALEDSGDRSLR
jgi:hypothetical protein